MGEGYLDRPAPSTLCILRHSALEAGSVLLGFDSGVVDPISITYMK